MTEGRGRGGGTRAYSLLYLPGPPYSLSSLTLSFSFSFHLTSNKIYVRRFADVFACGSSIILKPFDTLIRYMYLLIGTRWGEMSHGNRKSCRFNFVNSLPKLMREPRTILKKRNNDPERATFQQRYICLKKGNTWKRFLPLGKWNFIAKQEAEGKTKKKESLK